MSSVTAVAKDLSDALHKAIGEANDRLKLLGHDGKDRSAFIGQALIGMAARFFNDTGVNRETFDAVVSAIADREFPKPSSKPRGQA